MSYCHTCSLSQPFCDNCDNVTGFSIYTRIYVCALLIPFLKFLDLINNKKLSHLSPVTSPSARHQPIFAAQIHFHARNPMPAKRGHYELNSPLLPFLVINLYKKTEKNAFSTFSLSSISLCRVSAI